MNAIEKTKKIVRQDISVDLIDPHPLNPNKLTGRAYDLLVDNFEKVGITENICVRPMPGGRFQTFSGHHRIDVAKYLGFETVPCAVVDDPDFDDKAAAAQLARMNVIKGKMDPAAFMALYDSLAEGLPDDVVQDMLGFAESKEFQKLINKTAKSLPPELQDKFKESAKELKTIDGLAKLLNEMFTKHGSSLPYGYMIVDYGNQKSIWLQVSKKTFDAATKLGGACRDNKRTMDDLFGSIVQLIANGEANELLVQAVANTKPVVFPNNFDQEPTMDNLAAFAAM